MILLTDLSEELAHLVNGLPASPSRVFTEVLDLFQFLEVLVTFAHQD
jgi:hypothetical protein